MRKFLKKIVTGITAISLIMSAMGDVTKQCFADEKKENNSLDSKIVWIVEPVYKWEDVQAVKDHKNNWNIQDYYSRILYYEDSKAGMADYKGNIIAESSKNMTYDRKFGNLYSKTDESCYNQDGELMEFPYTGGDGFLCYWEEVKGRLVDGNLGGDNEPWAYENGTEMWIWMYSIANWRFSTISAVPSIGLFHVVNLYFYTHILNRDYRNCVLTILKKGALSLSLKIVFFFLSRYDI